MNSAPPSFHQNLASFPQAQIEAMHLGGQPLKQGELDRFQLHGVSAIALGCPWPVLRDRVVFGDYGVFRFDRQGENAAVPAFTTALVGIDGLVDVAAWEPKSGRVGLWLSRGFALGEQQISHSALGGEPLPVWRTQLAWLRAGRRGIVIMQSAIAWWRLAHVRALAAEDVQHGDHLEKLLMPPGERPQIVVPTEGKSLFQGRAA